MGNPDQQTKLLDTISAKIPRPTTEEKRAVQSEIAFADEVFLGLRAGHARLRGRRSEAPHR